MNLVPSVTTVMKIMAKPGLDVWKQEQLLLACLTLPRLNDEPEKEYIARILRDSKETGKMAAEAGTRIHESIEKYYRGGQEVEHLATATAFAKAVCDHFKTHPLHNWETEVSFADPLGFGGKVDLFCQPDEDAQQGIVIDAKTKDFAPGDRVDAYEEHLMQLAAYRVGLGMPKARCANIFASRTHPGLIKVHEWPAEELDRGWKMFSTLLLFWQIKSKFGEEK